MTTGRYNFFLLCFFFLSLLSINGQATGIRSAVPQSERYLVFTPNLEKSFSFQIFGSAAIDAYIEGDLKDYCILIDEEGHEGPRIVTVKLKLPYELPPGTYTTKISAIEKSTDSNIVAAVTGVRIPIVVYVLEDTPYLKASLLVSDANPEENISFSLKLQSWSYMDIEGVQTFVEIYDSENNTIQTLDMPDAMVPATKIIFVSENLPASTIGEGDFSAKAFVTYGINKTETNIDTFKVGTLRIDLVNHTTYVNRNPDSEQNINLVELGIRSNWNHPVSNLYAVMYIDGDIVRTPTVDLRPFGEATLTGYWDVRNRSVGEYIVNVAFNFNGVTTESTMFILNIVDPPEIEEPKGNYDWLFNKVTISLIAIIIVIILIDVIWLVASKRRKEGN